MHFFNRCWMKSVCGNDLDELFYFEVPKFVRIRDARLGSLYYIAFVAILVYIFIGQIALQNTYLDFQDPLPSVRMTLQQLTLNNCNPNRGSCRDLLPTPSSFSYCCNASCTRNQDSSCNCPWRPNITTWDCVNRDGLSTTQVSGPYILVETFRKDYYQQLNSTCMQGTGCQKLWVALSSNFSINLGIEGYTLAIDHSLTQPELGITLLKKEFNGTLFVDDHGQSQNDLCRERPDAVDSPVRGSLTDKAPCYIQPDFLLPGSGIDVFSISTLLRAMGVDLKFEADVNDPSANGYNGLIVSLRIKYFNVWPNRIGTVDTQYVYQAVPLLAPYKQTQEVWLTPDTKRIRRDSRGILFSVVPTGKLGKFNFQTLLITLTTSLALTAFATVIVRMIAVYVLRRRRYYEHLIYHVSADFSDVRELELLSDQELLATLNLRSLPRGGTREQKILRLLEDLRLHDHQRPKVSKAWQSETRPQSEPVGAISMIQPPENQPEPIDLEYPNMMR